MTVMARSRRQADGAGGGRVRGAARRTSFNYDIYFWCAAVSPHLLPLFYAACDHPRVRRAVYIGQKPVEPQRLKLGWETNVRNDTEIISNPDTDTVTKIVRESSSESIHVFFGMRWHPCIVEGLRAVQKHDRRFGLFSEPRVWEGGLGVLRFLHSWSTEFDLRRNVNFILAIGAHGPTWFRRVGYNKEIIFPAAYFLSAEKYRPTRKGGAEGEPPVISFVGRLEEMKGFALFLESLALIKSKVSVIVAGSGSLAGEAKHFASEKDNFHFAGVVPMSEVSDFMARTDILVLPSITMDDGWGAVVSEALMAGAAVVASEKVGASMCLDGDERGFVTRNRSAASVANAIDEIIRRGLLIQDYREIRSNWATRHLSQESGIAYLLNIFDYIYHGGAKPISFLAEHKFEPVDLTVSLEEQAASEFQE